MKNGSEMSSTTRCGLKAANSAITLRKSFAQRASIAHRRACSATDSAMVGSSSTMKIRYAAGTGSCGMENPS